MVAPIANPIINSPYLEPVRHWELDEHGNPTGEQVSGRRPSEAYTVVARARKGRRVAALQPELSGFDDLMGTRSSNESIAAIRRLVGDWRSGGYQNVTPTTRALLEYWNDQSRSRRLFFAQVEAVETAVYLAEVGSKLGKGWVGEQLVDENAQYNSGLPRLALKMATGTGKTVVMAMLITWQVLNKVAAPQDGRFTKKFLLVAPGITIRDRLRVLMPSDANGGYYREMDLIPPAMWPALLQARIAITNFHNFKPKATREADGLARNTKLLLLGRKKFQDPFIETPGQMVNRVLRDLGKADKSKIIVINDEAHHCYQTYDEAQVATHFDAPTADQLTGDAKKEANLANIDGKLWFTGLKYIMDKVGIKQIYDLSATPSFLTGSGYPEGLMFPWTVSDFSLLDAIEAGLVKIPRVPVDDDAASKQVTYLNLWSSIPDDDRRRLEKGKPAPDENLPAVVDGALLSLYQDYEKAYDRWENERTDGDGSTPPVFIVVCANMRISKWIHQKIAGYEVDGVAFGGGLDLFANYDAHGRRYDKMRTILVNSQEMENPDEQLSSDFKAAAAEELAVFHDEYRARYPDRNVDAITEKDLLREVLNTVGKAGKLGQDVRCVVSVSMLTEGWDANTVSHILGIRAFGSHLLCEQVIGRGLRRVSYDVNAEGLYEPEYAEVYGIPFQLIQTDPTKVLERKPRPIPARIKAQPDRVAQRIVFPRLDGYQVEVQDVPYQADFSQLKRFEVSDVFASRFVVKPVVGDDEHRGLYNPDEPVRTQEVAFAIAGKVLARIQRQTGGTKPWLFANLLKLSKDWIHACVGADNHKALVAIKTIDEECDRAVEQVEGAIFRQQADRSSLVKLLPVFQRYAPEGSTDAVDFFTTKAKYEADPDKCPVNYVVLDGLDGNKWEQAVAELLESLSQVDAYVKNDHLDFRIPYNFAGRAHWYAPDFIVRLKKQDPTDEEEQQCYLIVEVSGMRKSQGPRHAKAQTARDLWCASVNNHGGYGIWGFTEVDDPNHFKSGIVDAIRNLYAGGEVTGTYMDGLPVFDEDEDSIFGPDFLIAQTTDSTEGN